MLIAWQELTYTTRMEFQSCSMIGENRQLVTNDPAKFEKQPVEVQDCRKITDHFRGIYRI